MQKRMIIPVVTTIIVLLIVGVYGTLIYQVISSEKSWTAPVVQETKQAKQKVQTQFPLDDAEARYMLIPRLSVMGGFVTLPSVNSLWEDSYYWKDIYTYNGNYKGGLAYIKNNKILNWVPIDNEIVNKASSTWPIFGQEVSVSGTFKEVTITPGEIFCFSAPCNQPEPYKELHLAVTHSKVIAHSFPLDDSQATYTLRKGETRDYWFVVYNNHTDLPVVVPVVLKEPAKDMPEWDDYQKFCKEDAAKGNWYCFASYMYNVMESLENKQVKIQGTFTLDINGQPSVLLIERIIVVS